ncbi:hypothetical protein J7E70_02215 [Variovorax paradoxus]|nr:hypothetical protein [Variovorax paradoxus]MBT2299268.1 hypothetical protein [Variovorax paradoxus]
MNVIKIMPSHESQGPFVLINEGDFDPKKHELYEPQPEIEKKPSDGLKVDEIKAALAAKNIVIPEGVTLKADLAALLDAAPAA